MANPAKDLIGQRFGYLTVIKRAGTTIGVTQCATWLCQCDCGNQVVRKSQYLRTKHRTTPRSCGCHHGNEIHKLTNTVEFNVWAKMRQRVLNPSDKNWLRYGGRGITVCERWRESFVAFYQDMGPKPKGYTLDRIDNNGPYSPENCRWATPAEQSRNRKTNLTIDTPEGRMTISEAAERRGMQHQTLSARIFRYQWPIERALNEPLRVWPSTTSSSVGREIAS